MAEPHRERVDVALGIGELIDSMTWEVKRRDIQWDGAAGVWDGYGHLAVKVNGTTVAALTLQEDRQGRAVLVFEQVRHNEPSGMATVIELEREGIVSIRPAGAPSKREKWGG